MAVVTLDGGEVLEVASEALPDGLPAVGQRLDASVVAELRLAASRKRVARRLFQFLDRRLQTVARLRDKLLAEDFDPAAVDAVLADMQARDIHSDRRYAEAWVRDTLRTRAVGRRYLVARLREKGVAGGLADEVVAAQLPAELERALARTAARQRWARTRGRDWRAQTRVAAFLAGRGFPTSLCAESARAMRPASDEMEDEAT